MCIFTSLLVAGLVLSVVNGQVHDKPEGSPCEWMNAQGTCVHVRRCHSFRYKYRSEGGPPICSFDGKEPIVCCVDCHILDEKYVKHGTVLQQLPSDLDLLDFVSYLYLYLQGYVWFKIKDALDDEKYESDRKYEKKCFEYQYLLPYECKTHVSYNYKRIYNETRKCYNSVLIAIAPVGGRDALRGDFPHMALLGYGPDVESAQWLCGGSLISERFILTAGHCASSAQLGDVKYVALGLLKRSDPPHFWKRYKVKRFIPHPEYHPPIKYNDIALIETEISMNFTEGVRPACLTHKPEFEGDNVAFATGWGALGKNKENADVMQKVILQKFTAEECAAQYPVHRHLPQGYNQTTQICYGDHKQIKDTCQGDSGGPLQKRDPDARYCPYAIIGVTSYGRECGHPGAAGIYTRVYHYLPWIESIVWP